MMNIEEPIEDRDLICIQRQINIELRQELAETKAKLEKAKTIINELAVWAKSNWPESLEKVAREFIKND